MTKSAPAPLSDAELEVAIHTDPGCDHPLHREEVYGAMMALQIGARWWDETLMDCGCILSLVRLSESLSAVDGELFPGV